jgi:hypothetical protein
MENWIKGEWMWVDWVLLTLTLIDFSIIAWCYWRLLQ